MPSNVPDPLSACQAECARTDSRLTVLPQVSGIGHTLSSQDVTMIVIVLLALATAVVLTAIWAGSDRRKAALDVLERLLRWRW